MSKFSYPIESEETALRVQQLDLTALKPFVLEMPSSIYIVGKRKTA